MIKKICLLINLILFSGLTLLAQQTIQVKGKVLDKKLLPLAGTTIEVTDGPSVITDSAGLFIVELKTGYHTLLIKNLAFQAQTIKINVTTDIQPLSIVMEEEINVLQEVEISTGYQKIPKERSTGSFGFISKETLTRVVSTNITDRLQYAVAGLTFNRDASVANGSSPISIRGQNTLFANTKPLVVVDNFVYEGDLANINPNDVENITILKDAAAASIWGARAGNGVIVITTKNGQYNQAIKVNVNANFTTSYKPDQFYQPRMSAADYIAVEKQLFDKGFYKSKEIALANTVLSPIVELLIAKRDGKMSAADADAAILRYSMLDNRNDIEKYLYRNALNKQYAVSLNGGGAKHNFSLSLGYDQNETILKGNDYDRFTINLNNNFLLLKDRLEIRTGFAFNRSNTTSNNPGTTALTLDGISLPYLMLADENGNALGINRYREAFSVQSVNKGLLNWQYNSLQELAVANNANILTGYRLNAGLKYKLNSFINLDLNYQYYSDSGDRQNLQTVDSYFVRNQINRLTVVNADGTLVRPIPLGSILDQSRSDAKIQNFRSQVNINKDWNKHNLTAIGGYEIRGQISTSNTKRSYGFDEDHYTSKIVDYLRSDFPLYYSPGSLGSIPGNDSQRYLTDRYISWFANFAYTYRDRYVLTGSARLDQSNLFGVEANQKGVPLYAVGAAWIVNEEAFYKIDWLPKLKLRLTYGYNGNIDKTLSAYTTARYSSAATGSNLPYATVVNPPNPELRWERVRIINSGLDFVTSKNRISGSIEFYYKNGYDLIGEAPYGPAVGIFSFRGNTASTSGKGVDITLNTINLNGKLKWNTTALFSYGDDKVTKYLVKSATVSTLVPIVGRSIYSVWAYPWAGLDPQTGDPQGYLNGVVSKDYGKLLAESTEENMLYMGSSRPKYFGAVRNTFSYGSFELSANISYRLGYVFRRNSIRYTNPLNGTIDNGLSSGHGDYYLRWQKSGDELQTNVPSLSATSTVNRDNFYANSSVLFDKADHIRLEDITLNYSTRAIKGLKAPFNALNFYVYANNLGVIWKKTKLDLDPDYAVANYLPVKTIAIGAKLNF